MNFLCKNPKSFDPKFDDRDFKGEGKNYMAYLKKFSQDPIFKKLVINNDLDIANSWLREATGKDITIEPMNKQDWKVAMMDLRARSSEMSKGFNPGFNDFKVLQAVLRKLPQGKELYGRIASIMSYKNENRVENSRGKEQILKGVSAIAKDLKIELSELSKLEASYLKAPSKEAKLKAKADLDFYLKSMDSPGGRAMAGQFYNTIANVMEGAPIESLQYSHPKTGIATDWSMTHKKHFKNIRDGWVSMRKNLLRTLTRGMETEIAYIKKIESRIGNQKQSSRLIEELKSQIMEMEIKSNVQGIAKVYDLDMNDINKYGLDKKQKHQISSEYMPHYVLDFIPLAREVRRNLENNNSTMTAQEAVESTLMNFQNKIDSMKRRGTLTDKYHSKDPFYIIEKYMNDVSFYNYKTNMNDAIYETVDYLTRVQKNGKMLATSDKEWVDTYVDEAFRSIQRIQEKAFIGTGEQGSFGNNAKRFLTATAFFRNIGLSVKSPIQNAAQRFWEYVHLGAGARSEAKEYLSSNNMEAIYQDQLRAHGLKWASDNTSLAKIYQIMKSEVSNTNSFRGDLEEAVVPGLRRKVVKDDAGNERVEIDIVNEGLFEKTLQTIEKISAKSGAFHTIVENYNRTGTFKAVFGRIHKNLMDRPLEWKRREFNSPKASEADLNARINNKAGREAYNMTINIHGDYSNISKPHALTTNVGSVIGQYKHYLAFMTDMQYNLAKHGLRDMRAGRWTGEDAKKLYRIGFGYTMAGLASAATGYGFSNFIAIESLKMITDHYRALTADPNTEEGQRTIRDSLYRSGLLSNLGPSFNAGVDIGRLFNFYELEEGSLFPIKKFMDEDVKDLDDLSKRYKMTRLLNGSMATRLNYTLPSFFRGNREKAIMSELGLHTRNKYIAEAGKQFRDKVVKTFDLQPKDQDRRKSQINQALEALLN